MLSMLQALPNTALWYRLEKEERLYECNGDGNQTTLMNFVPTRPLERRFSNKDSGLIVDC
jgi:hypothetical protein